MWVPGGQKILSDRRKDVILCQVYHFTVWKSSPRDKVAVDRPRRSEGPETVLHPARMVGQGISPLVDQGGVSRPAGPAVRQAQPGGEAPVRQQGGAAGRTRAGRPQARAGGPGGGGLYKMNILYN